MTPVASPIDPDACAVRNRKSGRMVYYSLNDAHVRLLLDVSAEHLRHEPNR